MIGTVCHASLYSPQALTPLNLDWTFIGINTALIILCDYLGVGFIRLCLNLVIAF